MVSTRACAHARRDEQGKSYIILHPTLDGVWNAGGASARRARIGFVDLALVVDSLPRAGPATDNEHGNGDN